MPVLLDGEDRADCESAYLVMLVCDRHREAGRVPVPDDPARGRYYQWVLYLADTIDPAYPRMFHGERFGACDLYLLMLASRFDPMAELVAACPHVARCTRAVAAQPAVARALEAHDPAGDLARI